MSKYLYGAKQDTATEFYKKYGYGPFSKIFPFWETTIISMKNKIDYGFSMIIYTKKPLSEEIIKQHELSFIKEEMERKE